MGIVHVLPFSIGLESDREFKTPAVLAEFGWTPIGPRTTIDPKHLGHSQRFGLDPMRAFGLFAQVGYKFEEDSGAGSNQTPQGGDADQSAEKPDHAITRIKAELVYGFDLGSALSFMPKAVGWYDIKNDETYYKLEALIRLAVVKEKYFFDLKYEKGSGAPNFNEGDQFSTGLALAF